MFKESRCIGCIQAVWKEDKSVNVPLYLEDCIAEKCFEGNNFEDYVNGNIDKSDEELKLQKELWNKLLEESGDR